MNKKVPALLAILFFVILTIPTFAQSAAPNDQELGPVRAMVECGTRRRVWLRTGIRHGAGDDGARIWTGDDGPGLRLCTWRRAVLS